MGKTNNVAKVAKDIIAVASAISAVVAAVANAADIAKPTADAIVGEQISKVSVPEVCKKGFPVSLQQATEMLNKKGLQVIAVPVILRDADSKYKDCIDYQVVATNPSPRSKVLPNEVITVKYVTKEVIEASRRIFDEQQQKRADEYAAKENKRIERAEKLAAIQDKIGSGVKNAFSKKGKEDSEIKDNTSI